MSTTVNSAGQSATDKDAVAAAGQARMLMERVHNRDRQSNSERTERRRNGLNAPLLTGL